VLNENTHNIKAYEHKLSEMGPKKKYKISKIDEFYERVAAPLKKRRNGVNMSKLEQLEHEYNLSKAHYTTPGPIKTKTVKYSPFMSLPVEIHARIAMQTQQSLQLMATCKKFRHELGQHLTGIKLRVRRDADWKQVVITRGDICALMWLFTKTHGLCVDVVCEMGLNEHNTMQ
jgi:hypothetical protein